MTKADSPVVVQPGVEFGSNSIFEYDRAKAAPLSAALQSIPGVVYEARSSDYQTQQALTYMVEDHFAILKVGPWLTFAYREALLALSAVERELDENTSGRRTSAVREALEQAMLQDPTHWRPYYQGKIKSCAATAFTPTVIVVGTIGTTLTSRKRSRD